MSRLPNLERALHDAAARLDAPAEARTPARPWWRRSRTPLLAAAAALAVAGTAFAATGLLRTGAPVPSAGIHGMPGFLGTPGRAHLMAVRVPDPDGGPSWGLSVVDVTRPGSAPGGARPARLFCARVGRVQDGRLGVVGRDGVFHDDGRFHPLPLDASQSGGCGGFAADGSLAMQASGPGVPASGYTGDPTGPVGGCIEAALDPAATSPQTRRRLRGVPVCSPASLRLVAYGFAGPDVVKVEYGNDAVHEEVVPTPGSSGAYLFVVPESAAGTAPLELTFTTRDGTRCTSAAAGAAQPGCEPGHTPMPTGPATTVAATAVRGRALHDSANVPPSTVRAP